MQSQAQMNAELTSRWGAPWYPALTINNLRRDIDIGGFPHVDAASIPHYEKYPADLGWEAIFPWTWVGWLLFTIVYNCFDAGRGHWGTKGLLRGWWTNFAFDALAVVALAAMCLNTIATANATFVHYGELDGLERDANVRQFAAVFDRTGVNFAWSLVLTDVLEAGVILTTWYYGRRHKNLIYLLYLVWLVYAHTADLLTSFDNLWLYLDVGLFFRQLGGLRQEFQGGGPQVVVGIA